jgi:protein HIRA/HIR1
MDFSPSEVLLATINENFSAVSFQDQSLAIYSCKGRRKATFQLDSPVHRLESHKDYLVALTTDGYLHRWNIRLDRQMGRAVSTMGILTSSALDAAASYLDEAIVQLWIHSNGLPIIITQGEKAFTLDGSNSVWVMIASGWFADCSPIWEGRTRGRGASMDSISGGNYSQARKEPIKAIESEINDLVIIQRSTSGIQRAPKPTAAMMDEFTVSTTLKHFEMRLQGAALLESKEEYRAYLQSYAKKLSDEGIRNQAEDLCRSLLGPIYHTSNIQTEWETKICGMEKRILLADVLKWMAKGRLLLGLVQTYQDLLRNVSTPW